jgi:type IV secretory pathway VirB2 component (pilin)
MSAPSPLRQPPYVAQESPTQSWIQDWVDFLSSTLPLIFLVVVVLVGILLIVRSKGGLQKAIIFGIGAALVFLILTNVEAISDLFGEELPIEQD